MCLEVVAARLRVDALEVLPVLDNVRARGARAHQLRLVHMHALLVVRRHRYWLTRGGVDHHLLCLSGAGRLLALHIIGVGVYEGVYLNLIDHLRTYILLMMHKIAAGLALRLLTIGKI